MANKKTETENVDTQTVSPAKTTVDNNFIKVRNVAGRPVEINFSDSEGVQRIEAKTNAYVDEKRFSNDELTKSQFSKYVSNGVLRVLKRNCKKGE